MKKLKVETKRGILLDGVLFENKKNKKKLKLY